MSQLIPADSQAEVLFLLREYFQSQKTRLNLLHKEIKQMGAKNKHALQVIYDSSIMYNNNMVSNIINKYYLDERRDTRR